jgi:phosphoketolase
MRRNQQSRNFRIVGPDETASNRWGDVFEATDRTWMDETYPYDDHLSPDGRVLEMLSEHTCQGWLEGYLLTGRHGFFSCYERLSTWLTPCSPARQVAGELSPHSLAQTDRLSQLLANLSRLAARP